MEKNGLYLIIFLLQVLVFIIYNIDIDYNKNISSIYVSYYHWSN